MKADFGIAIYSMVDTIAFLRELGKRGGNVPPEECDKIINEELELAYKKYEDMPKEELDRTAEELRGVLEKVLIWT